MGSLFLVEHFYFEWRVLRLCTQGMNIELHVTMGLYCVLEIWISMKVSENKTTRRTREIYSITSSHVPSLFLQVKEMLCFIKNLAMALRLRAFCFFRITTCLFPVFGRAMLFPKVREYET
jgi:hypothetical protein